MVKKKKFAVVISGCGVYDGTEIHEAVLSLYAISKNGAEYQVFAPDIPQHHVINHISCEEMNETRNVLVESARIARGNIEPLSAFKPQEFDALIFPGGFGAAKNLSTWAFEKSEAKINPDVERSIKDMVKAGKPIGALCISPVLLAKVLDGVEITIGDNKSTIEELIKTGANHKEAGHGEIVIDRKYKVVTTPCYMLDSSILQIGEGIENVVKTMLKMT